MAMNPSMMLWLNALISFFLFTSFSINTVSSTATLISYTDHCSLIIPESTLTKSGNRTFPFIPLHTVYYTGGNRILNLNLTQNSNSVFLRTQVIRKTDKDGVLVIEGSLMFQNGNMYDYTGNVSHGRYHHRLSSHKVGAYESSSISFKLHGLWSEFSGQLCMVGIGFIYSKNGNWLNLDAILKLSNLKNSSSLTSLVTGTFVSLSSSDDTSYFQPISILMLPRLNYQYTFPSGESGDGSSSESDNALSLPFTSLPRRSFCSILSRAVNEFNLQHVSNCSSANNCSPFFDGVDGFFPDVMSLNGIECLETKKRLRVLIEFRNSSYVGFNWPFNPYTTLIGEGSWDEKKNQLCIVACHFLDIMESWANAHVGNCTTRLSLRFPAILSIRETNAIMGKIWSNKTVNDSGYFDGFVFRSSENRFRGVSGLKYEYTEIDRVRKSCHPKKPAIYKGEKYPNPHSSDMKFDMSVRRSKERIDWGYADPVSVADQIYIQYYITKPVSSSSSAKSSDNAEWRESSLVNISYNIGITLQPGMKLGAISDERVRINAEGIYNVKTGSLCMVGCRKIGSNVQLSTNDSIDCEILLSFQFPPLKPKKNGGYIEGTIKSTRKNFDPLYFDSLDLSLAAYITDQAEQFIWRMDLEITMVLISNTLACLFVGLQLFHVKKHHDLLPYVSIDMLSLLTLGYMIPLLLNFEALFFQNRYQQNVLLGSSFEWLEVIARVVTMVAFLLQCRLLQLSWTARSVDGNQKDLWIIEKKTLLISLLFYTAGALIALLVSWRKSRHEILLISSHAIRFHQHSFWEDLKSYAGLMLDGFLLPQILLNVFRNSKENALSCSFYIGTTFVRLLPHEYDLYRAQNFGRHSDGAYIYANPGADFYSLAWDVIIPLGGLLFVAIIYLQQRLGGQCILPQRFRELEEYEKVPVGLLKHNCCGPELSSTIAPLSIFFGNNIRI